MFDNYTFGSQNVTLFLSASQDGMYQPFIVPLAITNLTGTNENTTLDDGPMNFKIRKTSSSLSIFIGQNTSVYSEVFNSEDYSTNIDMAFNLSLS